MLTIELELFRAVQDFCVAQRHDAEFVQLLQLSESVETHSVDDDTRTLFWLFSQLPLEMFVPPFKPTRLSTPIAAAWTMRSFALFMLEGPVGCEL